jgi:nitroreductase
MMNVSEAIRMKRAVRTFREQPLPDEAIHKILNAGRRAQSSKNTQPWHFIAITDKAVLKSLSETGAYAAHLAGAALGVAIIHTDPGEKFQIMFDMGQAAAYMQLVAWEMGIGSCLASIYQPERAQEILDFPAGFFLRIALSFGYPLEAEDLSRLPQKGGRKPLADMIHWNKW